MNPPVISILILGLLVFSSPAKAGDEDRYEPGDPFAAIDGEPIYLGELNLILSERFKARDLSSVSLDLKRATAALLVRRHLAFKSLKQQGGRALDAIIQRRIGALADEVKRRGSSLEEQAKSKLADEPSLIADLAWRTAWSEYLKSQLNEANLRRFFNRERDRYAGGRWQVSQIFIDMDSADEASVEHASMELKKLADQLRTSDAVSSAFAEAAAQHSDSGSASDGGMVGWVTKDGDLPAPVMRVIRGLAPGEVSQPIRSPLGMHLVLVHQAESSDRTFEQLSDQSQLRRDAADALFDALLRRQSDAKIVWFIGALQPPPQIRIVPE